MATRNFVPRNDGEGSIGMAQKQWGDIQAKEAHIGNRNILADGTKLDTHETEIDMLQTKVTTLEHAYAGAKAAATVADMTVHEQIYVYIGSETGYTNGNWYYYNGTAWVSGGVYNATALETDKTLTVSGAAADAKVTGYVRDQSKEYRFNNITNTRTLPSDWEIGYFLGGNGIEANEDYCYIKSYINVSGFSKMVATNGTCFYEFYDENKNKIQNIAEQQYSPKEYNIPSNAVYLRYTMYIPNIFENTGVYLCSLTEYNESLTQGKIGTLARHGNIMFTGDSQPVQDLNDITYNSVYFVQGAAGTTPDVDNFPDDFVNDGKVWIFRTYSTRLRLGFEIVQYLERYDGGICYVRVGNTINTPITWEDWTIYNKGITNVTQIIWDYSDVHIHSIEDANDAKANTIYRIQGGVGDASIANLPNNFVNDGTPYILTTYDYDFSQDNEHLRSQFFGKYDKILFSRSKSGNNQWSNWRTVATDTVIECGPNKQYTTLRSAIETAIQRYGTHVKVYPGTYDLTQEFATEIANHTAYGIRLDNDVYVEFMSGSYVTAIFDNSDRWFAINFQPFYSVGNGSFTLDGLNIKAQNTRYCVHDEHGGQGVYHHVYKNCIMHFVNTYTSGLFAVQCIGGGLGENGFISIEGGSYTNEHNTDDPVLAIPISYHNGNNVNALSKIFIKDVYLGAGHLRFGDYGPSTKKTPVYVCGCRMGTPIEHRLENQDFDVVNFEITEWNNDVGVS